MTTSDAAPMSGTKLLAADARMCRIVSPLICRRWSSARLP
jgi:hypothetical protein